MASPIRIGGCWTCRLRHVKCDETPAACRQCTSRRITCHGYGSKPEWMDGGEKEAEERQRIKAGVKQNFRRQTTLRSRNIRQSTRRQSLERSQQRVSSPPDNAYSEDSGTFFPGESGEIQEDAIDTFDTGAASPEDVTPELPSTEMSESFSAPCFPFIEPLSDEESRLVMHYLDHVFPLQYPYYSRTIWARGWLLWLLSKNGPLYRASMGLAALHQHAMIEGDKGPNLELKYHTKALRELQDFISRFETSPGQDERETLIEIICCGVALISFEILKGAINNWQPHLFATASVINSMCLSLEQLTSIVQCPPPLFMKNIDAALAFHVPVLIWMDVLACVSTNQKPKLPYASWLSQNDKFELANVIGCHNWALRAIGNLGTLKEWKLETMASGMFTASEFRRRAQQIENDLEDGIESLPITKNKDNVQSHHNPVTRIFAAAALVQLLILSADVSLAYSPSQLRRAVSRVILEIQMFQYPPSARSIIWPICVAGCVADEDQRAYFENLITSTLSEATGMIGNCETALKIMRRCWELKREQPDVDWECSSVMIEMGMRILLV